MNRREHVNHKYCLPFPVPPLPKTYLVLRTGAALHLPDHSAPRCGQETRGGSAFESVLAGGLRQVEIRDYDSLRFIVREPQAAPIGADDLAVAGGPFAHALRANRVGEYVVDRVFKRADGNAIAPATLPTRHRDRIQPGVRMENDSRARHHCESDQFRIASFMADDRRGCHIINLEQRDRIPRREKAPVEFRQVAFRVAMRYPAATVEDDEAVLQPARAEYWRADDYVESVLRGEQTDAHQSVADFSCGWRGEVWLVTRGCAFREEHDVRTAARGDSYCGPDAVEIASDSFRELHLDRGNAETG